MSEKIEYEPAFLIKILRKYRKCPILWDTTHPEYHKRDRKMAAWDKIVQLWQKTYPNASQSDIKTKIFHMRTNYMRQRKKVENNAGTITLWYYPHLCFLSGDEIEYEESESDEDEPLVPSTSRKRKASTEQESTGDYLPAIKDASAAAFGHSIEAQLQHLSKMQRCIAEKLISDVIYHGKLQQLTTGAHIKVEDEHSVNTEDIVIPPTEPSWYEMEGTAEPTPSCVTMADYPQNNVDETENAVNGIKIETDENSFYVSEYVQEVD
ncbi:uncharacterized protein LOC124639539 [Helicoverpa zea]|uniref:uncharacterized protein LOC124639539 n=1 Tax=Helicoverpa zea TaxID=7113 RepID=UPI001F573E04|nr:uncharacterized protein LOC124639539 [Helicoverpa zea]